MKFTLAFAFVSLLTPASAQSSPFDPCPVQCSSAGSNPSNWTYLHGELALRRCDETTIFDMSLYTPVGRSDTHVTFRACKASEAKTTHDVKFLVSPFAVGLSQRRSAGSSSTPSCMARAETINNTMDVPFLSRKVSRSGASGSRNPNDVISAARQLAYFIESMSDCNGQTILFANSGNAVVGLYIGREIHKQSAAKIIQTFIEAVRSNPSSDQVAAQVCHGSGESRPNTWVVGIYADPQGDIASVQEAVRGWSDARCLTGFESKEVWAGMKIGLLEASQIPQATTFESGLEQSGEIEKRALDLHRRAECRAIQVAPGDGCASLATRCGVSRTQLANYNKGVPSFCDTLKPDQWICCSAGNLPDFSPKPNPDGSCATYSIQPDDICFSIAETVYLTVDKIENLNENTWGWAGCKNLQPGQRICLSTGEPPMPAAISNAVCGPQVPNTPRPANDTQLQDLNPCPLNVCCNVWGQCGMTADFCIESKADTGAPGTSTPGANGCISNCGMDIVNNEPPTSFSRVAYFEAWNTDRNCLYMDVDDIDTDHFTHIHFAFAEITPDFQVNITGVGDQFTKMKSMSGIKRILSFGGWAFSVERPTYTIFREGVTPANRLAFANNVVNFINEHGLEGVDFDWEYPAAPDLPNIPPGIIEEGKNYLEFLKLIKRRLPTKSVSIAAPASYWYLKGYPIKEIGKVVDYIIYMTYDLHGQWDYGNKWSSEGCPEGNCLRSHVNITETRSALAMITKAGVPSKKVFCGIASYGRSFKMAREGCTGPMCHFTGSNQLSDAAAGICTSTSGYIAAAEIREIIDFGKEPEYTNVTTETWHDGASNSDILVYNGLEWVAWMSDATKRSRSDWYEELGFGGTSDWAVDLDRYGGNGVPQDGEDGDDSPYEPCEVDTPYESLEDVESALDSIPRHCRNVYISGVLEKMLNAAITKYNDVNNGYDGKFQSYARYMKKTAPDQLDTFMSWIKGPGQAYFDCDLVDLSAAFDRYTGKCPVPDHGWIMWNNRWELEYTLTDEEGFYGALLDETGLDQSAIEFGDKKEENRCFSEPGVICGSFSLEITNSPLVKEDFEPPNPKDIVERALENVPELRTELIITSLQMAVGRWEGSDDDILQVLSMPIFMIIQAVEAMEDAKDIGEDIEEQEQKSLILEIISAILFFVPLVGQTVAVAANMARLARMIAMAGALGDVGLALVDIINDPEMAPLAILGMLSTGKLRSPKAYQDAAKARRSMSAENLGKLGGVFKKHDDVLQNILKTCAK